MAETKHTWYKEKIDCPLCNHKVYTILGIRGNREYFGANPNYEPHIYTNVVRCLQCNFIYTNPIIRGLGHLESDYYNNPEIYQASANTNVYRMFKKRLTFISAFKNGGNLLDLGAGKGEFLYEASKKNWHVTGIEPSSKFCEYAKSNYRLNIHNGFLGEINEIPELNFDVVTLNHVLEHVDNPSQLLHLISGYLKDDGIIFIEVPNTDSLLLNIIDIYFKLKRLNWSSRLSPLHPPFHKYGFNKKSISYLLKKCNYKIICFKTFPGQDRGFQYHNNKTFSFARYLRNKASFFINIIGNRELLAIIAKPLK